MIYPLLPVFLASVLGANASFIGAIEGSAETTASLLKLLSGWWSDKVSSRKPFVVAGYLIASIVRPFTAATHTARQVLAIRVTDRVGKGIRTSARDARSCGFRSPRARGRAFDFMRRPTTPVPSSGLWWRSSSSSFMASARSTQASTYCRATSMR
jgi:MFS family permease